jgi:hypothetical protein
MMALFSVPTLFPNLSSSSRVAYQHPANHPPQPPTPPSWVISHPLSLLLLKQLLCTCFSSSLNCELLTESTSVYFYLIILIIKQFIYNNIQKSISDAKVLTTKIKQVLIWFCLMVSFFSLKKRKVTDQLKPHPYTSLILLSKGNAHFKAFSVIYFI